MRGEKWNSIVAASRPHLGMASRLITAVLASRSMLLITPFTIALSLSGSCIRIKSELLLDSESIKNCAETTTLSSFNKPDKISTSWLSLRPSVTATDLKRPSPKSMTTRSWLPVRITASLAITNCDSVGLVVILTSANIFGLSKPSWLAKRKRTRRVRFFSSRVG